MHRVWLAAALGGTLALASAGCWDRRELETLAVATAVAFDRLEPGGTLLMTAQFAIPARITGAAGATAGAGGLPGPGSGPAAPFARTAGGPSGPTAWLVGTPAPSVTEAMAAITALSPRLPFWAHVRLLVVGEELARAGLARLLDALLRDREFRHTPWVLVARGLPAYRVLELPAPFHPSPSESLTRLLQNLQLRSGTALPRRLHDFLAGYAQPGIDPVVPGITYERPIPHSQALTPTRQELPALHRVAGTAVFRDDRLVGWLSEDQTRDLLMLLGESRLFTLASPCPTGSGRASVTAVQVNTRREVERPLPRFRMTVNIEGNLAEQTCEPPLDPAGLRRLERQLAESLRASMQATLRRLHGELRADPVGFGLELYRRQPRMWGELAPRWREVLPELPVEVNVRMRVRRSGIATGKREPVP